MFRARAQFRCVFVAVLIAAVPALSFAAGKRQSAEVKSVKVVPGENGPVVEIQATKPLNPKLQTVEGPLRLVIDLPGATLNTPRHRIPFRNEQIKSIRMDQYQSDPAVARVVVDLAGPVKYTWDAMGNRLRIRLSPDQAATAKPPSVPALVAGPQPIAVPVAIGTSGSLIETGSRVSAGSTITAGDETAILRLTRGGEVRVCPGTTVSVSTSSSGQDLMLGMSKGAMETHYGLQEQVDSVLTPDFRIVLPGPGEFNLAVSADSHGNTCVGSMPGSTSSAVIAELFGNGTYEIRPEQQVVFHKGRLDTATPAISNCGCPLAQEPVLRTAADPESVIPGDKAQKVQLSNSADPVAKGNPSETPLPSGDPSDSSSPKPKELKVHLEAPLVFSGRDMVKAHTAPAAAVTQVAALPLKTQPSDPLPAIVVLPPSDPKTTHKGFFGKMKHFFGGMFH